jgi:uncharacterized repeat protein (TIGR03803 family)
MKMNRKLMTPFVATLALVVSLGAPTAQASSNGPSVRLDGSNGSFFPYSPNCGSDWCYGTTWFGGSLNMGTVYRVKPDGTGYSVVGNFEGANGLQPSQAPAISTDGKSLYGTTSQGGDAGSGAIYLADTTTGTITALASFTGPNGSTPQAPPIIVGDQLFGVAGQGGKSSRGVVWTMPRTGGDIKVLHSFVGGKKDVATPFGALTLNPHDGMLYGMAFAQAANGLGGIFRVNPKTGSYKLMASFTAATGGVPQTGALVVGPDKALYGNGWALGKNNGGSVFRYNPKTNQIKPIFFYAPTTGIQPYSGVVFSPSGKWIYSLTWRGGKFGGGTLLAIKTDGSDYRILQQFGPKTGLNNTAAPTITPDGKRLIYTQNGGKYPLGVLYSMRIPASVR